MTTSAIYRGRIAHARTSPKRHAFSYATYMLALDLDELDRLPGWPILGIERIAPLSFRRRDYRGEPSRSLKETILDDVARELGIRPRGRVTLLTHVRAFGFVFNPVSFYYVHDEGGELVAVVAEINNTPWNERHAYVLRADGGRVDRRFDKAFHVSPFMPMTQEYHWRFSSLGDRISVEMTNHESGQPVFSARLSLTRIPLTRANLARAAIEVPAIGLRVLAAIYGQALVLFLKRVPTFVHPKKLPAMNVNRSLS